METTVRHDYLAFMPVRDSQLTIIGAGNELIRENFLISLFLTNIYDREVSVTCPDGYVVVISHSKDMR